MGPLSADATRFASIDIDVSRPPRDRYQLLGHIGATWLTDIYLARMFTGPGGWQELMVKHLRPGLQARPEFVQAAAEEAIHAAPLHHEGIASVIEIGDLQDAFFLTTELVRGVTLRELHRRAMSRGDAIPMQFALKIACDALVALAHAEGHVDAGGRTDPIAHGSLAPDTIYVTYKGALKLADFGIANVEARLRRPYGSPYASPEQARGERADGRSDLFSLGLVLYEIVMNRPIDEDKSDVPKLVRAGASLHTLFDGAPLPPALGIILECALGMDPRDRYSDALSMKKAIDDFQRERARAATQENLGRFVQDQFADRLRMEERARLNRDDELLVKSMQMTPRSTATRVEGNRPSDVDATVTPEMEIVIEDIDSGELRAAAERPFREEEDESTTPGDFPDPARTARVRRKSSRRKKKKSSPEATASPLGRIGDYVLLRRLGFGSMAEVFLARKEGGDPSSPGVQKLVAVKRILPHLAIDETFVEMFMSEARLSGRLSHPNVVEIYGFGSDDSGQYFIAQEFVSGWDLAKVLDQCRARKEIVPVPIALRIMSHVCAALHAGHTARGEKGELLRIVHRDVAPQNILISMHGHVKLTDFGIAKANDSPTMTRVGEIRGKPAYMAPERMVPDPATTLGRPGELMTDSAASERGDIFSVGVVLFEIVTMTPLFRRETPFLTLMATQRDPIPSMSRLRSEVPRALEHVVERAASRWPSERYPTAHALQTDIERVIEQIATSVTGAQIAAWLHRLFTVGDVDELSTDAGLKDVEGEDGDEILTAVMPRDPTPVR
jgi:serine/threonine protein kinase